MVRFETRLAKLEVLAGCPIAPNQRDPELVAFYRLLGGADVPLEHIPCGVSAKPFIHRALVSAKGTSFPVVP